MKHRIILSFTLILILLLTGCHNTTTGSNGQGSGTSQTSSASRDGEDSQASGPFSSIGFVSEDYPITVSTQYNSAILKETKDGIHFFSHTMTGPGLLYYDKATGNIIPLCNKPECPHDGNEFCVATNSNYIVFDHQLYNDKILMNAVHISNNSTEFKLLCASLDGSTLEELVTFYTTDQPGLSAIDRNNQSVGIASDNYTDLLVHKNKALVTFYMSDNSADIRLQEPPLQGCAYIDLNNGKVTFLNPETPLSKDNPEITNIYAHGDYIYYSTLNNEKPKKKYIYRINVLTDEQEEFRPQNFLRGFSVIDDNTILYVRNGQRKLSLYDITTNVTKDFPICQSHYMVVFKDDKYADEAFDATYGPADVFFDGEYVFASPFSLTNNSFNSYNYQNGSMPHMDLYVYDKELTKELAWINLLDYVEGFDTCEEVSIVSFFLKDNRIYYNLEYSSKDNISHIRLAYCTVESLLNGAPEFITIMDR